MGVFGFDWFDRRNRSELPINHLKYIFLFWFQIARYSNLRKLCVFREHAQFCFSYGGICPVLFRVCNEGEQFYSMYFAVMHKADLFLHRLNSMWSAKATNFFILCIWRRRTVSFHVFFRYEQCRSDPIFDYFYAFYKTTLFFHSMYWTDALLHRYAQ